MPLLHRSQANVWKSSRLQVPGLPNCPESMTEQQYAGLLFGLQCHVSRRTVRAQSKTNFDPLRSAADLSAQVPTSSRGR